MSAGDDEIVPVEPDASGGLVAGESEADIVFARLCDDREIEAGQLITVAFKRFAAEFMSTQLFSGRSIEYSPMFLPASSIIL